MLFPFGIIFNHWEGIISLRPFIVILRMTILYVGIKYDKLLKGQPLGVAGLSFYIDGR